MENGNEFLHWLELPEAVPVRFGDLPMLIAAAQFPGDTDHAALCRAGAAINIEARLKDLANSGALSVRNPLGMARMNGAIGHALREAVLMPQVDLAPLREAFAIGLRFIEYGTGPAHWTIEKAAAAIAAQEGWHAGARDTLRDQMMQAARTGALTVRHPHTGLAYRPVTLSTFYELVTPADVNTWLALDPVAGLRWKVEAPQTEPAEPEPAAGAALCAGDRTEAAKRWTPERRKKLLEDFRDLDGKRPGEKGKKGKHGALAALVRKTSVDKDTLGLQLDTAIKEKASAALWEQLNPAK